MKARKKTAGPKKRDHSFQGDRGLGEVPPEGQRPISYGPQGAVDKGVRSRRKLKKG